MCDWQAEEYAEYLLWVRAEKARARARIRTTDESLPAKLLGAVGVPAERVEA